MMFPPLTPLEETVPGKELAERWRKKGQQEGQKIFIRFGIKEVIHGTYHTLWRFYL